LKKTRTRNTQ